MRNDLTMTTVGRKTGRPRRTEHAFDLDGERLVLVGVGSEQGPLLPGWYRDLMVHPDAEVLVGRESFQVKAHTARGAERRRLWKKVVAKEPIYQRYADSARGEVPVVVLEKA
ncbi:nitroreductase/quinone reductase family protein [Nonomuraea soli]|uniref:Deazaflavin-dependent oxidoreductase (Nitroreductase family) n=1 Tax=Nonomuraea soli TaxID=1032476 RepID=A0A7W0CKA4_9ACTN|nr:nitroreductase/quinone reductase family protein [Nonomuraea soli]MBA2892767.1 deazaflavin-dependent oxidoreductase (nitroreductase family) [Nonomuraea soli]